MGSVLLSVCTGTENARPHMRYAGAGDDLSLAVPPCLKAPEGLHSLVGAVSLALRPRRRVVSIGPWHPPLAAGAAVSEMPLSPWRVPRHPKHAHYSICRAACQAENL